jgi:transposase-like protein
MADKTVRYTPECRRQLVALARSARTAASLSKEFGPSTMTIGTWIKQAARDAGKGDGGLSSAEREVLNRRRFNSQAEARMAVFEWVEGWYNPHRRHSGLGYRSPFNYERSHHQARARMAALLLPSAAGSPTGKMSREA